MTHDTFVASWSHYQGPISQRVYELIIHNLVNIHVGLVWKMIIESALFMANVVAAELSWHMPDWITIITTKIFIQVSIYVNCVHADSKWDALHQLTARQIVFTCGVGSVTWRQSTADPSGHLGRPTSSNSSCQDGATHSHHWTECPGYSFPDLAVCRWLGRCGKICLRWLAIWRQTC